MDAPVETSRPLGFGVPWCDYDIIREIFTYFNSPYDDDGYHNGDMLLSYMLVNKFWGAIVQEKIWSRLKSDKPLMRLLMLDYASPQDGGKLTVARCSYKKLRMSRISDAAITRFSKYASLVKVLDKARDHEKVLLMTEGEVKIWESLAERLPTPVFPSLRSIGFELTTRGGVPAIFNGARPDTVHARLIHFDYGQNGRGLIQSILDFFPTVKYFHLNSYTDTNLRLICEPLNQQSTISTLNIRLERPKDGLMDIYDILANLQHPLTLTLSDFTGDISDLHRDQIPILSSLQHLTVAFKGGGWKLVSIIPKAPNLRVLQLIVSSQWPTYVVNEIVSITAAYQASSPFSTFVYRCDAEDYSILTDEPKALLRFNNLIHLEFASRENIFLSEDFLHSIAKASPSLRSLKVLRGSNNFSWWVVDATPNLVTLHGILRFTRHSPRLEVLHILLDAKATSNRDLWTRRNVEADYEDDDDDDNDDDEGQVEDAESQVEDNGSQGDDDGSQFSDLKIHISANDTPPHCLRELNPGRSYIDDAESVAAVLRKAFPCLYSIENVNRYSLWYNVDTLLSQDEDME